MLGMLEDPFFLDNFPRACTPVVMAPCLRPGAHCTEDKKTHQSRQGWRARTRSQVGNLGGPILLVPRDSTTLDNQIPGLKGPAPVASSDGGSFCRREPKFRRVALSNPLSQVTPGQKVSGYAPARTPGACGGPIIGHTTSSNAAGSI
jgi:hypothetical protein